LTFSYLTFERNQVWRDEITLWQDTIQKSPHKSRPYVNLGGAYFLRNDYDNSILASQKALSINPYSRNALYNLGSAYSRKGEFTTALQYLLKAAELYPHDFENLHLIAYVYLKLNDFTNSINMYQKLIQLNPRREDVIADYLKITMSQFAQTHDKTKALERVNFLRQFGAAETADSFEKLINEIDPRL
jgi:tetratricopeptide (TPR) repeat protein